jgi:hypothetical protein
VGRRLGAAIIGGILVLISSIPVALGHPVWIHYVAAGVGMAIAAMVCLAAQIH